MLLSLPCCLIFSAFTANAPADGLKKFSLYLVALRPGLILNAKLKM